LTSSPPDRPRTVSPPTDTDAFRSRLDSVPARGLIAKPFEVTALGDQLRSLLGWSE